MSKRMESTVIGIRIKLEVHVEKGKVDDEK